jgi:hypothetical protein
MRFKSELAMRTAWRIVASGLEQREQIGSIEPQYLRHGSAPRQIRGWARHPVHGMEHARLLPPYRADSVRPDLLERATLKALLIWC